MTDRIPRCFVTAVLVLWVDEEFLLDLFRTMQPLPSVHTLHNADVVGCGAHHRWTRVGASFRAALLGSVALQFAVRAVIADRGVRLA